MPDRRVSGRSVVEAGSAIAFARRLLPFGLEPPFDGTATRSGGSTLRLDPKRIGEFQAQSIQRQTTISQL